MFDNDYTEVHLSDLYREICSRLTAIRQNNTAQAVESLINYVNLTYVSLIDMIHYTYIYPIYRQHFKNFNRRCCARMMIWLYVYWEIYLKNGMVS